MDNANTLKNITLDLKTVVIMSLLLLIIFFGFSYFIMYTYNHSITKMNPAWKSMDYSTALMFTLFLMFVGRFLSVSSV
jgi:ABC-type sulfate transport system permease component